MIEAPTAPGAGAGSASNFARSFCAMSWIAAPHLRRASSWFRAVPDLITCTATMQTSCFERDLSSVTGRRASCNRRLALPGQMDTASIGVNVDAWVKFRYLYVPDLTVTPTPAIILSLQAMPQNAMLYLLVPRHQSSTIGPTT